MKIVLTGATGRLGRDLAPALAERHQVIGIGSRDLDITDGSATRQFIVGQRPDAVVHTAAWADVDGCERDPDRAYRLNAGGTWNLAVACQQIDAALLYISTDYVFDGEKGAPYLEFDPTGPINVYGASKLAGEHVVRDLVAKHYVVRASWFFGHHGDCFARWVLRAAAEGQQVRAYTDRVGSPSYTPDLARLVAAIVESGWYGVYHASNRGQCTWHEFAREILTRASGADVLEAATSQEMPRPARRPRFSALRHLSLEMLGRDDVRPWQEAVAEFVRIEQGSGVSF
jgi:dTDP-4-dehydrorhamnose reductase